MKLKTMYAAVWGLAWLGAAANAHAQGGWAEQMFEKLDHDFGVVARGADAKYRLAIKNKFVQPVHIQNIKTSCGCTAAKPSKESLASNETAYIEITMDTRKFTHQKDSSVTVTFDAPQFAEVRIPVKAYIRTDVVLTPGGAEFGSVTKGADSERKIAIAYAGRDNWTIRNVISKNPNISAKVAETGRGSGRVNYDLMVTIKGDAPTGELRDQVTLVTDDPNNPNIPVLVEARVETEYTVNPEIVSFGNLSPGEKKTINIVVRGKKPFSIDKIESEKTVGTFEVRLPQEPKLIHVLPLTVIAPTEAGTLNEEFTVTIGGVKQTVTFKAYGKIIGGGSSQAAKNDGATTAQTKP